MRIYSGTRPATGGTATTLLAELACASSLAASASGAVLTFNAIANDASADASGTPAWGRIVKSDGTTFVMDFSIAASASDMNMSPLSITAGQPVAVSSVVLTEGNA